ncbi:MAG: hypothetical protein E7257_01955 [Lachnospiraceae bacterium]|nr:hypothetical protein [Lachnospiraceae bacterium]MBQ9935985.1 hypothetical protein [Lachnospiraceae bacterium]
MSQAKVDKYKEEKKNRAKNVKKARVKKVAKVLIGAAIVGMIIGFPLGRIMYKHNYNQRMEKATISATIYDYWFNEYWSLHHSEKFTSGNANEGALSQDELDQLVDDISSNTDAIVVTPDNLNQQELQDAIEDSLPTE